MFRLWLRRPCRFPIGRERGGVGTLRSADRRPPAPARISVALSPPSSPVLSPAWCLRLCVNAPWLMTGIPRRPPPASLILRAHSRLCPDPWLAPANLRQCAMADDDRCSPARPRRAPRRPAPARPRGPQASISLQFRAVSGVSGRWVKSSHRTLAAGPPNYSRPAPPPCAERRAPLRLLHTWRLTVQSS